MWIGNFSQISTVSRFEALSRTKALRKLVDTEDCKLKLLI